MNTETPLITVIVAALNCSKTLERCLESIVAQTYGGRELIVMDGGSTDGTLAILDSYKDKIGYWESRPDHGIYHAWNKALRHAQGDWICFLGADDFFWDKKVLDHLLPHLSLASGRGIHVVYGQIVKLDERGHALNFEGKPWKKIQWLMKHGMPLPHPGLMHHGSLFKRHGLFDETFRIAGDYEFLLRELKNGKALYAANVRTVGCQIGGIADSLKCLAQREVMRARIKNGLPALTWLWLLVYTRSIIRVQLKKLRKKESFFIVP
jgi:glycosyltransferase involved in cell wall biosynthesis